jgi:hypothetical protein
MHNTFIITVALAGFTAGRELKELRSSTPCPEGDLMR